MAAGGDEVLDSSDGPQLVDRIATYLRTLCRISTGVYCGGILRMERSRLMVHVVKEAGIVSFSLPPKQFDALQLLAEHEGRVVPHADMRLRLWPTRGEMERKRLYEAVEGARRQLASVTSGLRVDSVRGVGYTLVLAEEVFKLGP
jgi:DNA-binding response OmpR family regulator